MSAGANQGSFDSVRFVLIGTTEPGNIGSSARAIKTMGFRDLALVAPRKPWKTDHCIAMGHGAEEILDELTVHDTLDDAIADRTLVVATTRRTRRDQPAVLTPREWSGRLSSSSSQERIAILFGPEKTGLSNDDILRARWIVTAPSPTDYPSMNLSQAVMVMAYESTMGLLGMPNHVVAGAPGASDDAGAPGASDASRVAGADDGTLDRATAAELECMYENMEKSLLAASLDGRRLRSVMRNLRMILQRAELREEDVNTFHSIAQRIRGPIIGSKQNANAKASAAAKPAASAETTAPPATGDSLAPDESGC